MLFMDVIIDICTEFNRLACVCVLHYTIQGWRTNSADSSQKNERSNCMPPKNSMYEICLMALS